MDGSIQGRIQEKWKGELVERGEAAFPSRLAGGEIF